MFSNNEITNLPGIFKLLGTGAVKREGLSVCGPNSENNWVYILIQMDT